MNYYVYAQKGNKAPVLIGRTKYLRDGIQLLVSYKKGFVFDNKKEERLFEKG